MIVLGLVLTFTPEAEADELAALAATGVFTAGECFGTHWAFALEGADRDDADRWLEWLAARPGVVKADAAFVHYGEVREAAHV
jgi:hypothetical protein